MFQTIRNGNIITLLLGHECLAINSESLRTSLFQILNEPHEEICLDFSATRLIDAAGIGVIAATVYESRRRKCKLTMTGATGSVLNTLLSTGIDRLLPTK